MEQFFIFVLVGFLAQIIDGALGMAYGVIVTGVLVSVGISPAVASAAVHTSEIVTTGISGLSHAMFKNIDYALFRRLAIPGILGSILGAFLLTKASEKLTKPFIAIYLITIGGFILYRALQGGKILKLIKNFMVKRLKRRALPSNHARGLIPLGFFGGFFDAAGGGGWGSIVNATLLVQGTTPHYTIGSVNLTEFLITLSVSTTFFFTIGITHWAVIFGLILGGAVASPFAAYLVRYIQPRIIMLLTGTVVLLLGFHSIIALFLWK
ncbi:Sulfite exporter TauE/SafE [Legionella gratiana]|uniref:Probable membrane transporter protein n=1 Tax=Legionella gratiana TaxID=45066 RepID=A0A378JM05_9GAMM|nr:sulfite exporter TauE/SafE family protein [Legionella gratiana]KTD09017.1 Sulfite exporter TauE/SafE [Legionella gratiana]STX45770.1 Sulfite exporter TauE/SafE [Legionella gratiana]